MSTIQSNYSYLNVKIKVNIPDSLADITLGQYQKWLTITGDDEFRSLKLIEIMCDIPLSDVAKLRYTAVNEIAEALGQLFKEKTPHKLKTTLNGVEFGFIPTLDEMSLGEYTDLEENIADWQQMHKAMAVLFRPVKAKYKQLYNIEEYEGSAKYAELMKQMPMDVVFGSVNFIYRLGTELCKDTLTSMALEGQMNSLRWGHSLNDGAGTTSTTPLPLEMLLGLKQLANLTSTLLSPTPATKSTRQKLSVPN